MTLSEAKKGDRLRVTGFDRGRGLAAKLTGLGIHLGEELTVVSESPIGGPILLEIASSGSRVMVGRGMIDRIKVERVGGAADRTGAAK